MPKTSIRRAYREWSSSYDSDPNRTRDLDREAVRSLLAERRFGRILEWGCGTGKNSAFLAGIGEAVTALDVSVAMLDRARRKCPGAPLRHAMADLVRDWPVRDHAYDLILFSLVLEHVEDLDPVLLRSKRALATAGVVVISELHPARQYRGTKANFMRRGETIEIPAFVHHLSDFLGAGARAGLVLDELREWWHPDDAAQGPPRILSLSLRKP